MNDLGHDEQTQPSPGVGGDAGSGRTSRHWPEPETAGHFEDREVFACPHCGHQLSMFREARSSPGDKVAARVASVAGSWPFLLILVLAILAWFVVNTILPLVHPADPSAMLRTALVVVAAVQGPLILLTQRRESDRDRARDIETFHISQNAEADLHSISHAINSALEQWGRDHRTSGALDAPGGSRGAEDPGPEAPPDRRVPRES